MSRLLSDASVPATPNAVTMASPFSNILELIIVPISSFAFFSFGWFSRRKFDKLAMPEIDS